MLATNSAANSKTQSSTAALEGRVHTPAAEPANDSPLVWFRRSQLFTAIVTELSRNQTRAHDVPGTRLTPRHDPFNHFRRGPGSGSLQSARLDLTPIAFT